MNQPSERPSSVNSQHVNDDAHDLMPDSLARTIPPLYATENDPDPVARVKWFTPDSSWNWYVVEYDPQEKICYGLVEGFEEELGYFSLTEIEQARGPWNLQVERDLYWHPTALSELQPELDRGR